MAASGGGGGVKDDWYFFIHQLHIKTVCQSRYTEYNMHIYNEPYWFMNYVYKNLHQ